MNDITDATWDSRCQVVPVPGMTELRVVPVPEMSEPRLVPVPGMAEPGNTEPGIPGLYPSSVHAYP